jgi:hypothetical protein
MSHLPFFKNLLLSIINFYLFVYNDDEVIIYQHHHYGGEEQLATTTKILFNKQYINICII